MKRYRIVVEIDPRRGLSSCIHVKISAGKETQESFGIAALPVDQAIEMITAIARDFIGTNPPQAGKAK